MREPFFGPNARPMVIQAAVGITVAMIAAYTFAPWVGEQAFQLSCAYITGSCLEPAGLQ